jgi:hypothetical protein
MSRVAALLNDVFKLFRSHVFTHINSSCTYIISIMYIRLYICKYIVSTMNQIESLKAQIEYMREIGCDKLANLLVEDLEKETAC